MDYSNIKLFSMLQTKMAYLSESQDVIAQNIANADTPGYSAKKMKDLNFKKLAQIEAHRLKLRATSPSHLNGARNTQQFRVEEQRRTYEITPVENTVALEEQVAKMAQNNHDYMTMTNLYTKTASMFKVAIGER